MKNLSVKKLALAGMFCALCVQHGIKAVTVDGKAISGNVLPLAAAGTEVTVQVTMG